MGQICSTGILLIEDVKVPKIRDINEHYTVLDILGAGASATVNRSIEQSSGSHFACKFMDREFENALELFTQEIVLLSKLKHSNILELHECYVSPKHFIILTAMCDGPAFFDFIIQQYRETGVCTEGYIQKATGNLLGALAHLEKMNIAHRDIKPENIMCRTQDAGSEIVLIDFGTAVIIKENTIYEGIVGTISYLAPEYLQETFTGKEMIAADTWAAGIVLFVLVSGMHPFQAETDVKTFRKIRKTKIPWDKCQCSEECTKFLKQLVERDVGKRYSASEALLDPWMSKNTVYEMNDVVDNLLEHVLQKRIRVIIAKLVDAAGVVKLDNCHSYFEKIDLNGDGDIVVEELVAYLLKTGSDSQRAKKLSTDLMNAIDHDCSGGVDEREFGREYAIYRLATNETVVKSTYEALDNEDIDGFAKILDMPKIELLNVFQYMNSFEGETMTLELFQELVTYSSDDKSVEFFLQMNEDQQNMVLHRLSICGNDEEYEGEYGLADLEEVQF